ncbi:tyrosine-type recombinase/integrase [Ornithinimicrobium tianjinense]|uniref:Prophage phiRv2 integrase n=1 Tax=Ornithinimicrobium tianjinense TaxID=1195761 RepID=A0A917BMB2_9MICO|nr:site-specific integrase [Ornithinimicrobium tianjinense]GGF46602.1 putative prophage phiRv2 integrase [Ornithinimicrobium tianjinense]
MTSTTQPKRRDYGSGSVRMLPSGKPQARFRGPDGKRYSKTWDTMRNARKWLSDMEESVRRAEYLDEEWQPPTTETQARIKAHDTLAAYAETWLAERDLKPRSRAHYRKLLDQHILPALGDRRPKSITPDVVRAWYAGLDKSTPTMRSHAYSLLRTIFTTAVQDGLADANPCHIRGASNAKRVHKIEPLSTAELTALVEAMPERYRAMTLLAAWCGLRFGELTELRRKDIDLARGVVKVRRGVTRVGGEFIVGTPKSDAGVRDVAMPPQVVDALREHMAISIAGGREGLLFPAADGVSHLAPSTLYGVFYPARRAIGRPDLRWHDLRHTGAVLAAQVGATTAELMGRLGHSSPGMAMRYQHTAKGRDAAIAAALGRLSSGE